MSIISSHSLQIDGALLELDMVLDMTAVCADRSAFSFCASPTPLCFLEGTRVWACRAMRLLRWPLKMLMC